jgi:hypothetical protein
MSAESLCDACKDLLRGIRKEDGQNRTGFTHHSTAESFALAIELECPLCIRLEAAFCDGGTEGLEAAPTDYFFALPHSPSVHLHHEIIFWLRKASQIKLRLLPWTGKH